MPEPETPVVTETPPAEQAQEPAVEAVAEPDIQVQEAPVEHEPPKEEDVAETPKPSEEPLAEEQPDAKPKQRKLKTRKVKAKQ